MKIGKLQVIRGWRSGFDFVRFKQPFSWLLSWGRWRIVWNEEE